MASFINGIGAFTTDHIVAILRALPETDGIYAEIIARCPASTLLPVAQTVTTTHLYVAENGVRLYPVKMRYVWASELDLMARLAGLKLRNRSSNW